MKRAAQLEKLARLVKRAIKSSDAWDSARSVDADPFIAIEWCIDALESTKPKREFHYLVIGYYTKKAIGCCYESSKEDVLAEEPKATFKRIAKRNCHICNHDKKDA